jgi:hypothetical protein
MVHEASYDSGGGGRSVVEWVVVLRMECAVPRTRSSTIPVPAGLLLGMLFGVLTAGCLVVSVMSGGVIGGGRSAVWRVVVMRVEMTSPSAAPYGCPDPAVLLLWPGLRVRTVRCMVDVALLVVPVVLGDAIGVE